MFIHPRALPVAGALAFALFVSSFQAAAQDKKPAPKVDKAQQAEIAAAVKIVDDAMAGQPVPADFKFTWVTHMMKGREGKEYVPFLMLFDKDQKVPPSVTYYVRVANRATIPEQEKAQATYKAALTKAENQAKLDPENVELAEVAERLRTQAPKVEYAFEDLKTFNLNGKMGFAFRIPAAIMVPAGDYDVYVLLKEPTASVKDKKAQPKAAVLKAALTVPDFSVAPLMTSSVMLSKGADAGQPAQQLQSDPSKNPYVFFQISADAIPLDPRFDKKSWLSVSMYLYNTGLDSATNQPNLTVDFAFYHKADGGEKFFNKTPQQQLNGSNLGAKFDPKIGVFIGTAVPLESFPEGDFRLEIKITDKVTGKAKVENALFTVIPG
jgi:hypothetical protein